MGPSTAGGADKIPQHVSKEFRNPRVSVPFSFPFLPSFYLPFTTSLSLHHLTHSRGFKHICRHNRRLGPNSPTREATLPENMQLTAQSRDLRVINFFLCPGPHILPITEFSSHPSCDHLHLDLHRVSLDSCPLTGPSDSRLSLH